MFNGLFNFSKPLCVLGQLYMVILFARAILSWFPPPRSGSPMIPVIRFLGMATEPVLAPLRRVIPPAGGFDISFIVVFFILQLVIVPILCRF